MKNLKKHLYVWMILSVVLIAMVFLVCQESGKKEPLRAPDAKQVDTVTIETAYGTLAFPEELTGTLRHLEATEGNVAVEVFYMVGNEGEKELFRIVYADAQVGTLMGYLTVDGVEVPVTYSTCEYADEDFKTEDERKLYYSMMDAFSVVMNSVYEDARFSQTKAAAPVGAREVRLKNWKLTLPENVYYTETEENGNYRVDVYGDVSGERVDLYTIGLGEMEGESVLGWYTVGGKQQPVVIQTYSLDAYDVWPDEERLVIYDMMNTLNTLIQTIMSDKDFSELEAEA